jgi:hypothetical protein
MSRSLWRPFVRLTRAIGAVQSRIILTLFYFVVLAPFALAVRLCTDPLGLRHDTGWHWLPTPGADVTLDAVRRQS